ncbi:MAG: glutamate mutase L, partial [Bdellovibrionales bacterium]|nr:glutamate mutase L [Bdellovibrionales bacterium]
FNRTVSANLGMSYSVANVLLEAGPEAISRWLPFELSRHEVRDRLRNKMIRPTSIPQTKEDLWLEQAVCREALRLSLDHHKSLAVGLSGNTQQRSIGDVFSQKSSKQELLDPMTLDLVIGSGGVLSHAPKRLGAALMMLDGFGLQGFTEIAVDSIFMMPHLGVLASVHPEAAEEIFVEDCLIRICHSIVPIFRKKRTNGSPIATVKLAGREETIVFGSVKHISVDPGKEHDLLVTPHAQDINCGAGAGAEFRKTFISGTEGIILDGRNRPVDSFTCSGQAKIFEELGL